jgi:hypothetical protein
MEKLGLSKPLNEETVKNRYLNPFLQRLGFDLSELSFEDRFTVRIGRKTVCPSTATGILDMLVKRREQNLFLVEAKRQGEELTTDDRDQGISYASLLRPIAPYVLLTNGDDFRLYSTLSREEVSGDEISPGSDFTIALPQALVEEATSHFLGLSRSNLAAFSKSQVSEEIKPLLGSKSEPYRKFIPELFVKSKNFIEVIDQFLSGPKVLFALIGDSGGGKTCCICDFVRRRVEHQQPVLFYRGVNLNGPILEAVVSDFGWTFSENLSDVSLVRRLARFTSEDQLLIVIDGIDEWEYPGRRQDLLATARRLSSVSNVRLVISCKTTVWKDFAFARGESTGIEDYLYGSTPDANGFILQPMSRGEFSEALGNYQNFYGVGRGLEDTALDAARKSPFFMRILFEVAQRRGSEHILLDSVEYFEKYLEQAISRLKHQKAARLLLTSLATALFGQGEERLSHADFVMRAGNAYSETALEELIEFQILEWAAAGSSLSFYFSLLRDYIIAFISERWQYANENEFANKLAALSACTVHEEALAFFYRYASQEKKRSMDSDARRRVERILKTYDSILSTHLLPLRSRFVPYTSGPIGYVGTFMPGTDRLGFCNFRELRGGDEEILLLPTLGGRLYDSNLPAFYQAYGIIGVVAIGDSDAIEWTVNKAIGHQLREIVARGNLLESSDSKMVAEALAGIVSQSTCGYSGEPHPSRVRQRPPKYPRQKPDLFPLETQVVRRWLRYGLLYGHFREKRLSEKLASGEIPVTHHEDGSYSYSEDLSYEDMKDLDRQIAEHLDLDEAEVRRLVKPVPRKLDKRVTEALEALEASGIEILEDELFPEHESLVRSGLQMDPVCRFLERAYSTAFESFVSIARQNFPTLYNNFPSIRFKPFTIVLAVQLKGGNESWMSGATIYVCEGSGPSTRFIARPENQVGISTTRDPSWRFEVEIDGEKFLRLETKTGIEMLWQRSMSLNRILYSGDQYLDIRGGYSSSWTGPRIPSILRTLVYDWLRQELPVVFAELCGMYNTEMESREWTFWTRAG